MPRATAAYPLSSHVVADEILKAGARFEVAEAVVVPIVGFSTPSPLGPACLGVGLALPRVGNTTGSLISLVFQHLRVLVAVRLN